MTLQASVNHATMHEMNMALVLNTLRLNAPISRAEIATRTGLNKTTVSSIMRTLLDNDFVSELGSSATTEVGRPSVNLTLNPAAGIIISGEMAVNATTVIATDFGLNVVARRQERMPHQASPERILERTIVLFKEVLEIVRATGKPIFGLSLGVPGLTSSDGILLFAPNLGWRDVPILALLEQHFDLPYLFVDNEANMAAQCEGYQGPFRNSTSLICIVADTGIGGGLLLNHRLETGTGGLAGEIGHMTLVPDGEACNCGNTGCWETVAAEGAVFRRVAQAIHARQPTLLTLTGDGLAQLSIPLILQAALQGDTVARHSLEETGYWLGIGIANLVNIFNPEHVILTGSLSLAHEFLLPVVKDVVAQRALSKPREQVTVAVSELYAEATLIGGAALIHHAVIQNPSQWLVRQA